MFLIGVGDKLMDHSFSAFSCFKHTATTTTGYGYLQLSNLQLSNLHLAKCKSNMHIVIQNTIQIMAIGHTSMKGSSLLITERSFWDPKDQILMRNRRKRFGRERMNILLAICLFTLTIARLSMTFTANCIRQKWNFCRLSSALCTVESKYLYLL